MYHAPTLRNGRQHAEICSIASLPGKSLSFLGPLPVPSPPYSRLQGYPSLGQH
jgi:hypothetical protein